MFDRKWKALIVTSVVGNALLVTALVLVYLHGADQVRSVRTSVSNLTRTVSDQDTRITDLETFKTDLRDSFNSSSITDLTDAYSTVC